MQDKESIREFTLFLKADPNIVNLEELYDVTLQLRNELNKGDIEFARLVHNKNEIIGNIPSNRKSGDELTIGAILLGVAVASIPNVIVLIQNWLLRRRDQTVRIKVGNNESEFEIPRDLTKEEMDRIITFIEKFQTDL